MIAIMTKYHGATNTKGSRISARANGNKIFMSYDYYHGDGEMQYKRVAVALCKKMGWPTDLLGGGTDEGYAFVFKKQ